MSCSVTLHNNYSIPTTHHELQGPMIVCGVNGGWKICCLINGSGYVLKITNPLKLISWIDSDLIITVHAKRILNKDTL